MRNFSRVIFTILLMILFVEVLVIAPDQLNFQEKQYDEDDIPESEAEQSMWQVHLVESSGGRRDWELYSKSAEGSMGKKSSWKLHQVKAIFYGSNGVSYIVKGDTGIIDTDTKNMEIKGNVKTKSSNGFEILTALVSYSGKERILQTPGAVDLKGPVDSESNRMTLSGVNMTILLDSSVMKIEENVRAFRNIKSGKILSIKSQKAEFNGRNQAARFANGVEMQYESMVMKGPEAFFAYREGSDLPSSIFINGGVVVTGSQKFATAENLKIDFDSEKYIFRGSPKVVQNGDSISGEEIIFLDGGKRVRVERVKAEVKDIKK